MNADVRLASVFLEAHPEVASKILESMPPEDAGEILAAVPTEIAGTALHHMLPTSSARCVAHLPAPVLGKLLERMPIQAGASLLRHFSASSRESVMTHLSPARLAALRMLLHYPANTVGAWMEAQVLTLPEDCSVSDALAWIGHEYDVFPRVYVVDRNRRVRGAVRHSALLKDEAGGPLAPLVERSDVLWARESIAQAHSRDIWDIESDAPVVNRQGEFVGILTHSALRRGLRNTVNVRTEEVSGAGDANELMELFMLGLDEAWKSLNDLIRSTREVR